MRGESVKLGLIGAAVVLAVLLILALGSALFAPAAPETENETAERDRGAPRPASPWIAPPGPEPAPPRPPESSGPSAANPGTVAPVVAPPVAVPVPAGPDAEDSSPSGDPAPEGAQVIREAGSNEPVAVPGGPTTEIAVNTLLRDGLGSVSGTVRLKGERKVKTDPAVPVVIRGRVIERESGQPIPDATVVLHSALYVRTIFYDHHLEEIARVTTDADGEFRVRRIAVESIHFGQGGLLYLTVTSTDHASRTAVPIEKVTPGYLHRVPDVVLDRGRHTVRGRVVDRWEGKPVAGGRVVATGEIHPIHYPKDQREALFLGTPQTVTNAKGEFVLENVGPGKQMISVHGGNDCAGYLEIVVPTKTEVVVSARQIRGHIEGMVQDEWNRPVPLVKVDGGENTTHTFADGTFVLENFRGDEIALTFTHADYRTATETRVRDGTRTLVVRLTSRHPLLRFRVRSYETNAPIPLVSIRLEQAGESPVPASPFYLSAAGVHAVRVPVGSRKAVIEAEGHAPVEVDLNNPRDGDEFEVRLQRKGPRKNK